MTIRMKGLTTCKEHDWTGLGKCPFCIMEKQVNKVIEQVGTTYPNLLRDLGRVLS